MKKIVDGIIVVEGTNDASFVSSFIDAEFVVLNGLELKNIRYLKAVSKFKKIFIFVDPDKEGCNIRNKLNEILNNCINVEIDINDCVKNNKKGVAESTKEAVSAAFSKYFVDCLEANKTILNRNIIMSLNSCERMKICDELNIENCNNKTLYKRLLSLNINDEKLYNMISEKNNANK